MVYSGPEVCYARFMSTLTRTASSAASKLQNMYLDIPLNKQRNEREFSFPVTSHHRTHSAAVFVQALVLNALSVLCFMAGYKLSGGTAFLLLFCLALPLIGVIASTIRFKQRLALIEKVDKSALHHWMYHHKVYITSSNQFSAVYKSMRKNKEHDDERLNLRMLTHANGYVTRNGSGDFAVFTLSQLNWSHGGQPIPDLADTVPNAEPTKFQAEMVLAADEVELINRIWDTLDRMLPLVKDVEIQHVMARAVEDVDSLVDLRGQMLALNPDLPADPNIKQTLIRLQDELSGIINQRISYLNKQIQVNTAYIQDRTRARDLELDNIKRLL
jgi:hypothetical protein